MKYTRFEQLPCWQTARELCKAVFDLINQREFRKDFGLRNEIWKSAGSVMDTSLKDSTMDQPVSLSGS